jgi:transposase
VQELTELQRQEMSIQGISKLTGWDRKTVRKYLLQPNAMPEYWPRRRQANPFTGISMKVADIAVPKIL